MKKKTILLSGVVVLFSIVLFQILSSYHNNDGHVIYPLDDTYIHMAISKNLAVHGVWGVSKYGFSSTSSSPFYTLLLAFFYKLFGAGELLPLILNIICGGLILFSLKHISAENQIRTPIFIILIALTIFLTPLPALIICGMAHTLQILLCIIFVYHASVILQGEKKNRKETLLYLLSPLLVLVRYECIFIVLVVTVLFLIKRRFLPSFLLLFFSFLPIITFGIISVYHGAHYMPNSLMLYGNRPTISIPGLYDHSFIWIKALQKNLHLFVLFSLLLVNTIYLYIQKKKLWDKNIIMSIIVLFAFILHLSFAKTGSFYRYEGYLIVLTFLVIAFTLNDIFIGFKNRLKPFYFIPLLIIFLIPLIKRSFHSFKITTTATKNIYEQQYQMGKFVKKYYHDSSIAANDIGAISFLNEAKLLDLVGLGTDEVVKYKENNNYDIDKIDELAGKYGTEIAIIYDDWFQYLIPKHWIKAGEWEITNNVICSREIVSFYAVQTSEHHNLIRNLKAFSEHLPPGVIEKGDYLKDNEAAPIKNNQVP